jgi:hypothetical protein
MAAPDRHRRHRRIADLAAPWFRRHGRGSRCLAVGALPSAARAIGGTVRPARRPPRRHRRRPHPANQSGGGGERRRPDHFGQYHRERAAGAGSDPDRDRADDGQPGHGADQHKCADGSNQRRRLRVAGDLPAADDHPDPPRNHRLPPALVDFTRPPRGAAVRSGSTVSARSSIFPIAAGRSARMDSIPPISTATPSAFRSADAVHTRLCPPG